MSAEIFRTVIPVSPVDKKVSYKTSTLLIGSCFTENIGERLIKYKLPTNINPFGIAYNPVSINKNIERLIIGNKYSEKEISQSNGLYFSFDHHSRFSDVDISLCLKKINTSFEKARVELQKASHLFITFGTSYYYVLNETKQVVSNCHKLPDRNFSRSRITVDEIIEEYANLLNLLKSYNPSLNVVFTVSPIRHWKDGAHENQLSKSVLFLAIDELCRNFNNSIYFPAYELMMDELRDYRFYEEDMLHPNKIAIDFIWKRFQDCFIDIDTLRIMNEVEKIQLSKQHRPLNTENDNFQNFVNQQLNKIELLTRQYPHIDLAEELHYFLSFKK